jgi:hypothetical protein
MHLRGRAIIGLAAAAFCLSAAEGNFTGQSKQRNTSDPERVAIRGDLVIDSLDVESIRNNPDGSVRVRFTVKVRLAGIRNVSCGAFKILAEWRVGNTPYTRIGEAGVASLSSGGTAVVPPVVTRTFEYNMPYNVTYTFRATVDSGGAVSENNELNNTGTKNHTCTGCPGVDLILTHVSLTRSGTAVRVSIGFKNCCVHTCLGKVSVTVDARAETSSESWVESEVVADRCEPYIPYTSSGRLTVYGRADRDLIVNVTLNVSGRDCIDEDLTNNTARVVLRAGDEKDNNPIHVCHI